MVDEVAPLGFSDDTIPAVILEGVQRTTEGSEREIKETLLYLPAWILHYTAFRSRMTAGLEYYA